MSTVALEAGAWRAVIDPWRGGCLLELTHAGRPILRPATEAALRQSGVRAAACYPLIPYANRIDQGRLRVAGREYRLRPNFPASAHPLHGLAWQRAWRLEGTDGSSAELALEHRGPEAGAAEDWPFPFQARERFELTSRGLTITLSVRNTAAQAWPAGLGLHPNFPLWPGRALQFEATGVWGNGPDQLPERVLAGADWEFREPRAIEPLALDNDFYGWARRARLTGGPSGALLVEASEPFSVLRVFTAAARGFVAVEPASHIADAVNRPQAPGSGHRLLEPGEVLAGKVTLSVEDA